MSENYQTVFENLPYSIKGFVLYNAAEDFYTIVLNCRFSYESMKKTFLHELKHIKNDDFHSMKTIDEIELDSHYEE